MEPIWSLGLMSGTSLDGVDAAWLKTDGRKIEAVGGGFMTPYPSELREKIRQLFGQREMTPFCQEVQRELTHFHAQVVRKAQQQKTFELIGFHGQTIYHAPPVTLQLGDGEMLASDVGVDVIYDFRSEDVARGGQGAPLVPIFHQAMVEGEKPVVIVNVGGVANLTWIQKDQPLIACDTGPGGALLDDWVSRKIGQPYDKDGFLAAQGVVDQAMLEGWLAHPYFLKYPPKSLDRDDFAILTAEVEKLSPADGAATLTELTARSIVHALTQMLTMPENIYVSGGGRHNAHLMQRLRILSARPVKTIEALGWDGDLLEAFAFAYLASRVKADLPTSFPSTTGVAEPSCGGRLAQSFGKNRSS